MSVISQSKIGKILKEKGPDTIIKLILKLRKDISNDSIILISDGMTLSDSG